MITQSFEITADISKPISYWIESFHRWFCSLVVWCLTCDHKVGVSIPCQEKAALLIRYEIVLFPPFRLKSEAEFIMDKFRCYVQINSVAKLNFK